MANPFNDGSQHYKPRQWRLVDGEVVEESDVVVHTFSVADAEDPDLIAGFSIQDWQKTDAGRWVFDNCVETPYWVRNMDPSYYGYRYSIVARLTAKNETFFKLKYK